MWRPNNPPNTKAEKILNWSCRNSIRPLNDINPHTARKLIGSVKLAMCYVLSTSSTEGGKMMS